MRNRARGWNSLRALSFGLGILLIMISILGMVHRHGKSNIDWDTEIKTDPGYLGCLQLPGESPLPVYDNMSDETLEKGVGLYAGSVAPSTETGTHCILLGHSGLPGMRVFDRICEMKPGDSFYYRTKENEYRYEVISIRVVKPTELSWLTEDSNYSYMSLVTCTPIGINSHRLVVTGVLIKEVPNES